MPAEQFRIDYSLKLVDAFAPGGHEKGFARIARADVADGLRVRIADPSKQAQSASSLCGRPRSSIAFSRSIRKSTPNM